MNKRFSVGDVVVAMRLGLGSVNTNTVSYHFVFIPEMHFINDITFKVLECVEYRKSVCAHSGRDADGFIFKDDDGLIYYNQYPTASYGQTDDSCDFIFRRSDDYHLRYYSYDHYITSLLDRIYDMSRYYHELDDKSRMMISYHKLLDFCRLMIKHYTEFTGNKPKFKPIEFQRDCFR